MATYELWLTDDSARRLLLLKDISFLNYTRTVSRLGVLQFGLPLDFIRNRINPFFVPDWRVEVWRSPANGIPLRREDVFMLRKPNVYTRQDSVVMIQFYGRNGIDLLNRRSVIQRPGTSYTSKTATADNIMKAIVREQMLYGSALDENGTVDNTRAWPQNEFRVQADLSLGPSLSRTFADRNVYDILKDLQAASFQYNMVSATNKKIYFDVVPVDISGSVTAYTSPLGWEFRTYAGTFGTDRTTGVEFSMENENIADPSYALNRLDEVTSVIVKGNGQGASQLVQKVPDSVRLNASRWNRIEKILSATSEASTTALTDAGNAELFKDKPVEELNVTLVNSPGSQNAPRSLYGLDWDLGDLVRVNYAGKQFNMEITAAYVAVDENGKETVTGRNTVEQ